MLKCRPIIFGVLFLMSAKVFSQNKDARDTCMVVLPLKIYYRDNGLHFISNCPIKKFKIEIFDPDGRRVFKPGRLRHDKTSYFVRLRNYHTGKFKWKIKYTMLLNGEAIVKELFGKSEFLN